MISLAVVMAPLTKALGLSIVVERVIELAKHIAQPVGQGREARVLPAAADAEAAVAAVEERTQRDARRAAVEQRAADRADERAAEARRQNEIHEALATETDSAKRAKLLAEAGRLKRKLEEEERGGEIAEQVPPGGRSADSSCSSSDSRRASSPRGLPMSVCSHPSSSFSREMASS
jgi:hypothetical protein